MTHELGCYTGWAIAIVLLFVIPLLVVFIEYLRRIKRQLKDIQDNSVFLTPADRKHGKDDDSRETD